MGRIVDGSIMIIWAKKLYLSENIDAKKQVKIMKSIEKGNLNFEVYCIMFASNPNNLFDIINVNELLFPYYSRKEIYILGVATSRIQAFELVKDILYDIYKETGGFAVREFFAIS